MAMGYSTVAFVFLSVFGSSYALPTDFEYDCTGLPENFLYWWACGSYGICRGGQYQQIDCLNGTVYDRRHGGCTPKNQAVTYPCNAAPEDCLIYSGPGHRYPDQNPDPVENLPPCTFYYTCAYGRYLGHQRCSEGTVYDEPQQRCLSPALVEPPCGNMIGGGEARVPFPFPGDYLDDGRPVIQPPTDNFGNPDTNKWPFTNNRQQKQRHQRNTEQGEGKGRPQQRLVYRSADRNADKTHFNPQDFNPAVYGINANEFDPSVLAHVASDDSK